MTTLAAPPIAPSAPANPKLAKMLELWWYSKIELAPGVFTPGQDHHNVGITQKLLRGCRVAGSKCLDIGAMEGVLATRMTRMGGNVIAVDGTDATPKINAVKNAYGVEFTYLPSVGCMELVDRLMDRHVPLACRRPREGKPTMDHCFDVVVCSGVLYHVWSPLHVIASIRSLMRPGALCVIETAFKHGREHTMAFNFQPEGYLYQHWSNTWFLTDSLLDHLLRLAHLRPIDCLHMGAGGNGVGRIAVVCRAVEDVVADPAEDQMRDMTGNFEFEKMLRLDLARTGKTDEVPYRPGAWKRVERATTGSCDLFATVEAQPACKVSAEEITLFLKDRE
jgi:SAM-dependent methyltransferase